MAMERFGGSSSDTDPDMGGTPGKEGRWIFSKDHLLHGTPSRKLGIPADKELVYRQSSAIFIQVMGRQLNLNQLVLHTATVYLNRFYMIHPFTTLHWKPVSFAALYLACKVEEEPRSVPSLGKTAFFAMYGMMPSASPEDDAKYHSLLSDMIFYEDILISTMGFEFRVFHPHAHIISFPTTMEGASADVLTPAFIKECYRWASKSVCYTTLNLELSPKAVACICIHACTKEWNVQIPKKDSSDWFALIDPSVTHDLLEKYTNELITTYHNVPNHLKNQLRAIESIATAKSQPSNGAASPCSPKSVDSGKGASARSGSGSAESMAAHNGVLKT